MPAELLTTSNGLATHPDQRTAAPHDELREWAREHLKRVHRLKLHVAAYVLGMVLLTPLWALVEWQSNGGFERWSENSQPGDWEPWILYVAIGWGLWVAFLALRVRLDRPTTEAEIDREIERLASRS